MLQKYYYTLDCDGALISENAVIEFVKAKSEDEATAKILHIFAECHDSDECEEIGLEPGDFWDCWIRFPKDYDPSLFGACVEPLSLEEVNVWGPGGHPGGPCTWITPAVTVYVPTYHYTDEDEDTLLFN